jgi:hypothetical protein
LRLDHLLFLLRRLGRRSIVCVHGRPNKKRPEGSSGRSEHVPGKRRARG